MHELPEGWIRAAFADVANIASNLVDPSDWPQLPHVAPDNIERDTGKLLPFNTVSQDGVTSSKHLFQPGQLLYSKIRPYLNKCVRVGFKGLCSADIYPLDTRVDAGYLHYYILTRQFVADVTEAAGSRTVLPKANQEQLALVRIPVAPLSEQGRIVAEIEKQFTRLDAGVDALKRLQTHLKRYRASVLKAACEGKLVPTEADLARKEGRDYEPADKLLEHLRREPSRKRAGRLWGAGDVPELRDKERANLPEGWVWAKVAALGSGDDAVQVGPMSMKSSDFEERGVSVLNVGSVRWGAIDESKCNHMPEAKAQAFNRYRVREGDVLFSRSGTVGRCAVARKHHSGFLMTFHLLRVRPDARICLPEYLRLVFEGAPHIKRQTREASIGSTRAGFNTRLLAELDVPLPSLVEQARIVTESSKLLSLVGEVDRAVLNALARSSRLRQSILKRAFEGKLVPQDPNDEPASVLLERIRASAVNRPDKAAKRRSPKSKSKIAAAI